MSSAKMFLPRNQKKRVIRSEAEDKLQRLPCSPWEYWLNLMSLEALYNGTRSAHPWLIGEFNILNVFNAHREKSPRPRQVGISIPVARSLPQCVQTTPVVQGIIFNIAIILDRSLNQQEDLLWLVWAEYASVWPGMVAKVNGKEVKLLVLKLEGARLI
jgi:hypothetical protein